MTVFFPCLFNAKLVCWEEIWLENFKSLQVTAKVGTGKNFSKITTTIENSGNYPVVIQVNDLRKKGSPELRSSPVKFGDSIESKRVSVSDPGTSERANNGEPTTNKCYFIGTKFQFWLALLSGGLLHLGIAFVIIKTFFYFTQQF
jgi:hypothetical protein